MDRRTQIVHEWVSAAEEARDALVAWVGSLREWEHNGGLEDSEGDFDRAFNRLYQAGLGDTWADACEAGGGVDALAAAVRGEELEEPGPMDQEALLVAIFGEAGGGGER